MATIGRLNIILSARVQGLIKGMTKSEKSLNKVKEKMREVAQASAAMAVAMGAAVAVVSRAAAKFERDMTLTAAIAGGSKSEFQGSFKAMSAAAMDFAATSKFNLTQIEGGMRKLTQAGNNTVATLAAMPTVMKLAAANSVDLTKSANIATNVMASFGITMDNINAKIARGDKEYKKYSNAVEGLKGELLDSANILTAVATGSNTDLLQLGEAFAKAGNTANLVGVSMEQAAGAIGVAANAGIKAEEAGTGLSRAMQALSSSSKPVQESMKKLGLRMGDMAGENGLVNVIGQLERAKKQFKSAGKSAQFNGLLFQTFGLRAGRIMAAQVNQGSEALSKLLARNEVLKDEKFLDFLENQQLKTFAGQVDLLSSALDNLSVAFGSQVNVVLAPFVKLARDAINFLAGFHPVLLRIAAATLIFGTMLAIAMALISGFIVVLIVGTITIKRFGDEALKTGLKMLSMTTPILAVVALMLLLVAIVGFVRQRFSTGFGDFGKFFQPMIDTIKEIPRALGGMADLIIDTFRFTVDIDPVTASFSRLGKFIGKWASSVFVGLDGIGGAFVNTMTDAAKGLMSFFSMAGKFIFDIIAISFQLGATAAADTLDFFGVEIRGFVSNIGEDFGMIGQGIMETISGLGTGIGAVFKGIDKVVTGILMAIASAMDLVSGAFITLGTAAFKVIALISEKLAGLIDDILNSPFASKVAGALGIDIKSAKVWSARVSQGAKDARENIDQLTEDLKKSSSIRDLLKTITETSGGVLQFGAELLDPTSFLDDMAEGLDKLINGEDVGKDMGKSFLERLKDFLPKFLAKNLNRKVDTESPGSKKAREDSQDARADLLKILMEESRARRELLSDFPALTGAFEDLREKTKEINRLGAIGDNAEGAALALKALQMRTESQVAGMITEITNSKKRADALRFVGEKAQGLALDFARLSNQIEPVKFDDVEAATGPNISELLFGQLKGQGVSNEDVKSITNSLGGGLETAISGSAPKIGSIVGTAIGTMFAAPVIGAAIGSGVESILGQLGDAMRSSFDAVVDTLASIIPESRLSDAFKEGGAAVAAFAVAMAATAIVLGFASNLLFAIGPAIAGMIPPAIILGGLFLLLASPLILMAAAILGVVGVFGLIFALIPQSEAFKKFTTGLTNAVDLLLNAFGPLDAVLMPLLGLFGVFLGVLKPFIDGLVHGLAQNAQAIFEVVQGAAVALGGFIRMVASATNMLLSMAQVLGSPFLLLVDILGFVANAFKELAVFLLQIQKDSAFSKAKQDATQSQIDFLNALDSGAVGAREGLQTLVDNLAKADGINMDDIDTALAAIAGLTFEQAGIIGEALAGMKETNEEFGEELVNIPQGFKVARERLEAIVPGMGNAPVPNEGEGGGDTQIVNIAEMVLIADDSEEFLQSLLSAEERANQQQTGGTSSRDSRNSGEI